MDSKAKPVEAWAIAAPHHTGYKIITSTRREAIKRFLNGDTFAAIFGETWSYWRKEGYRCVRVRVEEI